MTTLTIRPALPSDETAWTGLWRGYCDFYKAGLSDAVTRRTWARILDPDAAVMCIVAEQQGQVVGFANCVVHENTSSVGEASMPRSTMSMNSDLL